MITDMINRGWFPNTEAIMTSDYDDLKVGIDSVIKRKGSLGYLGAAFDFTLTNKDAVIHNKLTDEWDKNIKVGNVRTIKYFQDPETKQKGRLLVPRFMIGLSGKDVAAMGEAYLAGDQKFLDNYPLPHLMLEQIRYQLDAALTYFENNQDSPKLQFAHEKYQQVDHIIKKLEEGLADAKQQDPLAYHEYAKNSHALQVMKSFSIAKDVENRKKDTSKLDKE